MTDPIRAFGKAIRTTLAWRPSSSNRAHNARMERAEDIWRRIGADTAEIDALTDRLNARLLTVDAARKQAGTDTRTASQLVRDDFRKFDYYLQPTYDGVNRRLYHEMSHVTKPKRRNPSSRETR